MPPRTHRDAADGRIEADGVRTRRGGRGGGEEVECGLPTAGAARSAGDGIVVDQVGRDKPKGNLKKSKGTKCLAE